MKFTDKEENGIKRNVGDIFETTKERYEVLKQNNAVKLIEIIEEKKEEVLEDPYKDFEVKEEKPRAKKKKTNKK
jgi:hypothetical protein